MDDPRGDLARVFVALAGRARPRWLVFENVPGLLSVNGGRDFASLLRGLWDCGYGVAYRIFDAQYFGVAQRRTRVWLVGRLGSWERAAAVLFDFASMRGDPAPLRESRQDAGRAPHDCIDLGGEMISKALVSKKGSGYYFDGTAETLLVSQVDNAVRRLTPRECERLQGFPDDYTLVQYRGKPAKDGPRYRALGNAFPVPVVRWIGERIELVEAIT